MDLVTGLTHLHLGQFDTAQSALAVSARTFAQGTDGREGVVADTTLAQVHVQVGDSQGLTMAREAITAVSATKSANAHPSRRTSPETRQPPLEECSNPHCAVRPSRRGTSRPRQILRHNKPSAGDFTSLMNDLEQRMLFDLLPLRH